MPEKILHYCMSGKQIFTKGLGKKNSYPKPNQERKYCITGHHHHHLLAIVLRQILKDKAGCYARRPQETTRLIGEATSTSQYYKK